MKSTQILFFDEVHTKQANKQPTTHRINEYNIFPIYEEGKVGVERGVYDTNNKLKRAIYKYEQ